ncbi:hypothetical protein [Vibrio alginolyticus]|uniref:hypothetical protein n=1 Tax=Vibrio alginolyticus TaxID=663 RepID=UPI001BD2C23D|nr:hypothetical protein [Vibrio alginolyticus]MBS9848131.1 hypothetical protein [Vibrio alginolyticus]
MYSPQNFAYILTCCLLISGCGTDDGAKATPSPSVPKASRSAVAFNNVSKVILTDQSNSIELVNNQNEKLSEVKLINSEEKDCYAFQHNSEELVVNPTQTGNCIYQYKTETINGLASHAGVIHLAKVAPQSVSLAVADVTQIDLGAPLLPINSYAVQIDDAPLTIDMNSLHPDLISKGFSVSSAALVGESNVVFNYNVDRVTFETNSDTPMGVYRVYYGLTDGEETFLGQIDITVGNKTNVGFSIQQYHYETPLEIGQTATISLSELKDVIDNPEGDALEIVQISTTNASATTDGSSITFSAPTRGSHSLSYLVTDNRGAFVMGRVMFDVKKPFSDIKTPLGTLTAPITLDEALEIGFDYSTPNVDAQKSVEMATFKYDVAEAICTLYGAKLPSKSEIDELSYNNIKSVWPIDKSYVLQGKTIDEQGIEMYTAQSFKSDNLETLYVGNNDIVPDTRYTTCFKPYKIAICGDKLNDNDSSNAADACLKVREVVDSVNGKVMRFTSSPSLVLMNQLGYKLGTSNDDGDIYHSTVTVSLSPFAPKGTWSLFTNIGSETSMAERWCKKLSDIKFLGTQNWSLPQEDELKNLFSYENIDNEGMYKRLGWPTNMGYITSGDRIVSLVDGTSNVTKAAQFVSCVSNK